MAVLLMFTVALIAGQARANLPAEVSADSDFGFGTRMSIVLDQQSLQHMDSLPHVIDIFLALPIDIDLSGGELTVRPGKTKVAGSGDESAQ